MLTRETGVVAGAPDAVDAAHSHTQPAEGRHGRTGCTLQSFDAGEGSVEVDTHATHGVAIVDDHTGPVRPGSSRSVETQPGGVQHAALGRLRGRENSGKDEADNRGEYDNAPHD